MTPYIVKPWAHLVHLVCNEHQVVLLTEPHDLLLVVCIQALPCGVAGVDDHEPPHTQALALRCCQLRLQAGKAVTARQASEKVGGQQGQENPSLGPASKLREPAVAGSGALHKTNLALPGWGSGLCPEQALGRLNGVKHPVIKRAHSLCHLPRLSLCRHQQLLISLTGCT